MTTNIQHRFNRSEILKIFPELSYNPFIDRLFEVFSSEKDEKMSFEDVLDLASAFSEDCPWEVKAKWAFLIFGKQSAEIAYVKDIKQQSRD